MTWRKLAVYLVFGLVLSFVQSFFFVAWPLLIWTAFLVWKDDDWWYLIIPIGLFNDLLAFNPLGQSVFYCFLVVIFSWWLKRVFNV
ncbi:MAG: hypothetical protein ABID04_00990 [Patescibacteria group bacterium]